MFKKQVTSYSRPSGTFGGLLGIERRDARRGRWRDLDMRQLGSVLDSVVAETKFDLGKVDHNRNGVSTIYSGNPSEISRPMN